MARVASPAAGPYGYHLGVNTYLVGGAVRDALLSRPVKERDWVVVGATPEMLLAQGFLPVGRDFPVFLHPSTREEYALARLERKVGPGYRGFSTEFSPEVTLEQDLARRDLTINAMAQAADGSIIDPFGGRRDLEQRVLRHVSPAFIEDPVRLLRVARFLARFAPLGFTVAPETLELLRSMVASGEVDALVPERVWRELERALSEPRPRAAIELLRDCGALRVLMPEIDAGEHSLLALQRAAERDASIAVRFAVLVKHLGVGPIETLSDRWRIPQEQRELALLACRFHASVEQALALRPEALLEIFEQSDAFRRPERFRDLLEACECDARARLDLADRTFAQRTRLESAFAAAAAIKLTNEERSGLAGPEIGAKLRARRLAAIYSL